MPPKSGAKKGKKKKSGKGKKSAKPQMSPLHPALLDPEELLVRFLQRVLLWLQENHARIINLFRKLDSDNDNALSREDFFIGMRMMEAPASRAEIDRLISILDFNHNGRINILEFDKIIRHYHRLLLSQKYDSEPDTEDDEMKKSAISLTFSPSRLSYKCPNCEIGIAAPPIEKNLRFLELQLTLAPFKDLAGHPGHFSLEITDSTSIHGLTQLIKVHLEGSAATIAIFKDHTCSRLSYLSPSSCLFHCGAVGGPRTRAVEVELFYDYKPVMNDCPLLMDESHLVKVVGFSKMPSESTKTDSSVRTPGSRSKASPRKLIPRGTS